MGSEMCIRDRCCIWSLADNVEITRPIPCSPSEASQPARNIGSSFISLFSRPSAVWRHAQAIALSMMSHRTSIEPPIQHGSSAKLSFRIETTVSKFSLYLPDHHSTRFDCASPLLDRHHLHLRQVKPFIPAVNDSEEVIAGCVVSSALRFSKFTEFEACD